MFCFRIKRVLGQPQTVLALPVPAGICQSLLRCKAGCGSGSAKILPLPLPHRLFDLKSNLEKKFCPFPDVD